MGTWTKTSVLTLAVSVASSNALAMSDAMSQCLLERIAAADDSVTVGEINRACSEASDAEIAGENIEVDTQRDSVVGIRREADLEARARRFVISTHQPNYFLFSVNNDPNGLPYGVPDDAFDEEEIKFQVSFQMPLATDLFGSSTDLLFAYTSVSWWQLFNDEADNPFRETNYQPEVFFRGYPQANILGLDFISWEFGINHQSNGQSASQSRGWDRLIGSTAIEFTDDLVLGLRAWHILRRQDTNPDLHRYMGYGDIGLGWAPNRNTFTLSYRPATEGDAVQLSWSYPITEYLRVYAQYWNGYGESLIDYNVRTKRWGIGVSLSDVLARE